MNGPLKNEAIKTLRKEATAIKTTIDVLVKEKPDGDFTVQEVIDRCKSPSIELDIIDIFQTNYGTIWYEEIMKNDEFAFKCAANGSWAVWLFGCMPDNEGERIPHLSSWHDVLTADKDHYEFVQAQDNYDDVVFPEEDKNLYLFGTHLGEKCVYAACNDKEPSGVVKRSVFWHETDPDAAYAALLLHRNK